jgi:fimbrial protein
MRIDMGQYRTNSFSGVGSFSTVNVPFTVRLLDCGVDVSRTVGISFKGPHPQKILRSFWRHRDQVNACRYDIEQLFDERQRPDYPKCLAVSWLPIDTRELGRCE